MSMADPVGALEMAERLGVAHRTVHKWAQRKLLPPPDYEAINGTRAWEWATILRWAGDTGHIVSPAAAAEYKRRFLSAPVPPRRGGRPAAPGAERAVATRKRVPAKKAVARVKAKPVP